MIKPFDIKGSGVLKQICNMPDKRGIVLEGGSRSTKTWSIIQSLILYCFENNNKGKVITIARQRLTWLKATILIDFFTILQQLKIYEPLNWHKSEMTYNLFGNQIGFVGLDEQQKLHGRKQNVFWINEAMEATIDDFDQLEMRTSEYWILDYNPARTEHWIYSKVLQRPDAGFIHSTMLNNPFLEQQIIDKIKSFEPSAINVTKGTADETKWKIYGLGLRAQIEGAVYTNYAFVKEFPEVSDWGVGLDFGYTNDPTAIIRVALSNGELWIDELSYKTGMTNPDIASTLNALKVSRSKKIICDSAEPKSIEELRRMRWLAIGCRKGPDSINNGIDILKRYKLNITESSLNLKTEIANYTWVKDRATGVFLNTPIDDFNHGMDAIRYYALECLNSKQPSTGRPYIGNVRL